MKKVTVNLTDSQVQFIQAAAALEETTFTSILHRAIALEKLVAQQERMGNKLLILMQDGTMREILRP